jgi:hypothetical protein
MDRRRAARIPVDIPATVETLGRALGGALMEPQFERISVLEPSISRKFDAIVRDLSVDGAQLTAAFAPPLLTHLSLSFVLPGYGVALAMCIVRWRKDAGPENADGPPSPAAFGVLFEAVDLAVRRTISEIVISAVVHETAS